MTKITMLDTPLNAGFPDCTLCPLHEGAHAVGVPTVRTLNSASPSAHSLAYPALIVIGQNPGAREDRPPREMLLTFEGRTLKGRPFIGDSGDLLRSCYLDHNELGKHATIYLTNGARCGPSSTSNAGPFNACYQHLVSDLACILRLHDHARSAILFTSAPAVRAFHHKHFGTKVTQKQSFSMQGHLATIGTHRVALFSTYHAAYLLRGNDEQITTVQDHVHLLKQYLKGETQPLCKPHMIPPTSPS